MLAQAMLLILCATMFVVGVSMQGLTALQTQQQHTLQRDVQGTLDEGVDTLVHDLQAYVRVNGTAGPWPKFAVPAEHALCDPQVGEHCSYTYSLATTITGTTNAASAPANVRTQNLEEPVVQEERVSAQVSSVVQDRLGNPVASGTRFVTVRVFRAPPYAMVSGERDVSSPLDGPISHAANDNGGVLSDGIEGQRDRATPNPSQPDHYRMTTINIQLTCSTIDKIQNTDSLDPTQAPHGNQGAGTRRLPWGVGGVGYELPCTDRYVAPPEVSTFISKTWSDGTAESNNY